MLRGRVGDCLQHHRIGLVAVMVDVDAVAILRGPAGDASDRFLEGGQVVVAVAVRGRFGLRDGLAAVTQPLRPAVDAIDAEHEVEDRSEDRRQPGQADPADRRADLALAQQHVHGDHDGDQQAEGRP